MVEYLQNNWLEVLGTLVGLVYLWQELKASIYLWITGIIMPAIYIFVYYKAGLYADFGIQIYYLIAATYGYSVWKFGKTKKGKSLRIKHMPIELTLCPILSPLNFCVMAFVVSYAFIAIILVNYTNSNVPYLDTFTTALSIVGLWLLARKYIEQWFAWILVDAVCAGLYVYKEIYFTAALYALYTVLAVYGYFKWLRMMNLES